MKNYFTGCKCSEDVKKRYRDLAMEWHPDVSRHDPAKALETMKAINAAFEIAWDKYKDVHRKPDASPEDENATYTAKDRTAETAAEYVEIINQIIGFAGIKIEIIGTWLWCSGNTYPHRQTLKALGFIWASRKNAWCYHKDEYKRKTKKRFTMDEIRTMHGSESIDTVERPAIA